jgi:hypothetical protein
MTQPDQSVMRTVGIDGRDVTVHHLYSPAERGQILAFVWWVYVNRTSWTRRKLRAAVTAVSPLMLFSSTFLAEMTGIPASTASKCMIIPPDSPIRRVTGSCDMWVVHQILSASPRSTAAYRAEIRDLTLTKGVPKALMARLSGVPIDILTKPDRGVQFFAEQPDRERGVVLSAEQYAAYWREKYSGRRSKNAPSPGDQRALRDALAGTPVGEIRATHAPLPSDGELPYYTAIPGLPSVRHAHRLGACYFTRVRDWEFKYHLSASTPVGPRQAGPHP